VSENVVLGARSGALVEKTAITRFAVNCKRLAKKYSGTLMVDAIVEETSVGLIQRVEILKAHLSWCSYLNWYGQRCVNARKTIIFSVLKSAKRARSYRMLITQNCVKLRLLRTIFRDAPRSMVRNIVKPRKANQRRIGLE